MTPSFLILPSVDVSDCACAAPAPTKNRTGAMQNNCFSFMIVSLMNGALGPTPYSLLLRRVRHRPSSPAVGQWPGHRNGNIVDRERHRDGGRHSPRDQPGEFVDRPRI